MNTLLCFVKSSTIQGVVSEQSRRLHLSSLYSIKVSFRQILNALLARYFQARGLLGDLDFPAMQETQPDELLVGWLGKGSTISKQ